MSSKIRTLYQCSSCDEIHDYEHEASDCCQPEVYELFECPVCKKTHDEQDGAGACCNFEAVTCPSCRRDYGAGHINHFAVTVANHCNTCNPFFSPDQKIAIEDQYFRDGRGDAGLNS